MDERAWKDLHYILDNPAAACTTVLPVIQFLGLTEQDEKHGGEYRR